MKADLEQFLQRQFLPLDDKAAEAIGERYPVLTQADCARIYEKSMKKLEARTGRGLRSSGSNSVSGAEELRKGRGKWLAAAACIALVAGTALLAKDRLPPLSASDPTEILSQTQSSELTEPNTPETQATEPDYEAAAKEGLSALHEIDLLGACAVTCSQETLTKNDIVYSQVVDFLGSVSFQSTTELEDYLSRYLTDSLIQSRYSNLTGGEAPLYTDDNNALYCRENARSGGFAWLEDLEIQDAQEHSFTAMAAYDDFGASVWMKVQFVWQDGVWKIDSFSPV